MSRNSIELLLLLYATVVSNCYSAVVDDEEIVVKIAGGQRIAKELADELGFVYNGPVLGFKNTYLFVPLKDEWMLHEKRDMRVSKRLADDKRVLWADKQAIVERYKRDFVGVEDLDTVDDGVYKRPLPVRYHDRMFNDELWTQEWYLRDTRTRSDLPKLDLNVLPVYKLGFTGKGIRISILDDGIERTHEDLIGNYDPEISWDCNEDDDDPLPRYDRSKSNSHGTRCAGEVSMMANNEKCGVGVAYESKIGGIKLLDGLVNDRVEGTALSYARDKVDIYSASWGPSDDGKTVDGPGRLARKALENGVNKGRNGLGSIYVWASGNGGSHGDNCNCDGYLASPYTISIGSASQRGEFPWYGEACASTLAVTYSSGAYQDQMIATTDIYNECTVKHTGTSASAPLAAGIIALALEANGNLTWRDVQHLIVWTSEVAPVYANNPGWQINTAGYRFNTRFGFGLMNARGLVEAAIRWPRVPKKGICVVKAPRLQNNTLAHNRSLTVPIKTNGCMHTGNEVRYLEHVELKTSINYTRRGSLEVYLTSPTGTKVQLLSTRRFDVSRDGFQNWIFMSVLTWGEQSAGLWLLTVKDRVGPSTNVGFVGETWLILHGTKDVPKYRSSGPRNYDFHYNRLIADGSNNDYDDYPQAIRDILY